MLICFGQVLCARNNRHNEGDRNRLGIDFSFQQGRIVLQFLTCPSSLHEFFLPHESLLCPIMTLRRARRRALTGRMKQLTSATGYKSGSNIQLRPIYTSRKSQRRIDTADSGSYHEPGRFQSIYTIARALAC